MASCVRGDTRRRRRVGHLTTVDISLAILLGTELAVDVDAGFEVYGMSAPGPFVGDIERLGVNHVPVPALTRAWNPRKDLHAAGQLWKALRGLDLDVLHTHTPKAGVLGRLAGRAAGVPIVINTCHGLWIRPGDRPAKKILVYGAEAMAAQFSDAELYQNQTDHRALRRLVRAHRSATVGNGVDLTRFCRDAVGGARVRRELGVAEDEVVVGGIGRLVEEKGIREFAAAARALRGRARFFWVGPQDPDKPDHIRQELEGVTFLGMRRDMPAVYSALDVFALPSYREGFSRSGMEAAACGCALVLSDIRGCRELGTDGEHLILVPPGDAGALTKAVQHLIEQPERRRCLAAAAAAHAHRRFDQRRVARASLDTYGWVARNKGLQW